MFCGAALCQPLNLLRQAKLANMLFMPVVSYCPSAWGPWRGTVHCPSSLRPKAASLLSTMIFLHAVSRLLCTIKWLTRLLKIKILAQENTQPCI